MSKPKKIAKSAVRADRKLSTRAAQHREEPAVRAAGTAADLADQPPLIALAIATIATGAVLRRPEVVRAGARMLASHLLATAIKNVIKTSVDRTRPAKAIESGNAEFKRGNKHEHDETSFPSGHTAGAVAIASAVAHDVPAATLPVYATAAAVGAAQLPSGKHYLLDTLVGAVIGYGAEKLASAALGQAEAALDRIRRSQPSARRPDRSSPT